MREGEREGEGGRERGKERGKEREEGREGGREGRQSEDGKEKGEKDTSEGEMNNKIKLKTLRFLLQAIYLNYIHNHRVVIESVDSISRDERGFPLTQYITNGRISRVR